MPENPPGKNKCGTHASGWLNGEHPTTLGKITEIQVCFDYSGNSCRYETNVNQITRPGYQTLDKVKVINCRDYFLYKLVKPSDCSLRYCAQ